MGSLKLTDLLTIVIVSVSMVGFAYSAKSDLATLTKEVAALRPLVVEVAVLRSQVQGYHPGG